MCSVVKRYQNELLLLHGACAAEVVSRGCENPSVSAFPREGLNFRPYPVRSLLRADPAESVQYCSINPGTQPSTAIPVPAAPKVELAAPKVYGINARPSGGEFLTAAATARVAQQAGAQGRRKVVGRDPAGAERAGSVGE